MENLRKDLLHFSNQCKSPTKTEQDRIIIQFYEKLENPKFIGCFLIKQPKM